MKMQSLRLAYTFSVRVRYAPSPTGPMHLGAVRTALFNYLFAHKNKGKFIVRIEDTDTERNVPGSVQQILDTLDWLKISPDQSPKHKGNFGPYYQSERLIYYKQFQNQLLYNGFAYPCFCESKDHKNNKKENIQDLDHQYDRKCRSLSLEEVTKRIKSGQKYAIRIKSDIFGPQQSNFDDQLHGNVRSTPFDDFVIVKKNGMPTYHFANTVDDWKMQITHVIRGAEWLTNTPKHIYLYRLLKQKPPVFIHLPLILTEDGRKLSKRDPISPIARLKALGYLPQTIINYTGLMGLNTHQEEQKSQSDKKNAKNTKRNQFFTLQQLVNLFDIKNVKNAPIKSDNKKLNFFNRYHMRKKWKQEDKQFQQLLIDKFRNQFGIQKNSQKYSQQFFKQAINCIIERLDNYEDLKKYGYFFEQPNFDNQNFLLDVKKIFGENTIIKKNEETRLFQNFDEKLMQKNKKIIHNLRLIFTHVIGKQEYNQIKIAENISKLLYDNKDLGNEDVYHILRLAVTGRKSGVNIVKTCYILGRDRVESDLLNLSLLCSPK